MVTQLVYIKSFIDVCKDVIYENQYTLQAVFGTCDVDILYYKLFHKKENKEILDAILKVVKTRI